MNKIPQHILDDILTYATHLSPISTTAQWFLESGYRPGQEMSTLASPPNHNLFGIKANDPQFTLDKKGKTWNWFTTSEYENGKKIEGVVDKFRIYPSYEASIRDHDNFFVSTPSRVERYRKTREATTLEEEVAELGESGYATDPKYTEKIWNIINTYKLRDLFDESKIEKFKKGSEKVAKLTLEQAFAKLGLPFKKQLLPLTKTYGRVNRKEGMVDHQTGAPQSGRNAQWMANYQKQMSSPSNPEEKSWNYQVDDKEAIMSFEHDVATWQSSDGRGPGNMAHISIESCINSDGNYAKGIENLAKTMAVIAYVEGFDIEKDTKRHYDFARDKKWCPAQIMNGKEGFTYAKVKAMAQAHLNTLNGAAAGSVPATPVNTANPQGLETSKIPEYKEPGLPFDKLEKGQKVTFRNPWNWYDDSKKEFMHSKKHDELVGTEFTIEEIKEIEPIGYSRIAALSKEHNSWILEQDIVEARKSWKVEEKETDLKDEGKEPQELKEGQFWIEDTLYQVEKLA